MSKTLFDSKFVLIACLLCLISSFAVLGSTGQEVRGGHGVEHRFILATLSDKDMQRAVDRRVRVEREAQRKEAVAAEIQRVYREKKTALRKLENLIDNSSFTDYENSKASCDGKRIRYKRSYIKCKASAEISDVDQCKLRVSSMCKSFNSNFFNRCDGSPVKSKATWFNDTETIDFPKYGRSTELYEYESIYTGKNWVINSEFGVRFETNDEFRKTKIAIEVLNELCE